MSEIKFCPRGGQEGIVPSDKELNELGNAMKEYKWLDKYIPLPSKTIAEQVALIKHCLHPDGRHQYWETETGSHGWCCSVCGTTIQWG